MMVEVFKDLDSLSYRPYPGGSGSINGWADIGDDFNETYDEALADLADTFNQLACKQVGFDVQPLYVVPELTHTPGYRPKAKAKRKAKV